MGDKRGELELGAPGKPLERLIVRPDGRREPYPLPQTKWDNCAHLMEEFGERIPTDDELTEWELTRHEYEHFMSTTRGSAG